MKSISDDHDYIGSKDEFIISGCFASDYAQSGDGSYNTYGDTVETRAAILPNPKDRISKGWYTTDAE